MIDLIKLKNKSILITGASGLVGVNLLASIKPVQKEFNIKIYTWTNSNNEIFQEFFNDCEQIVCDITNINAFDNLPMFDYIIHASGYGQPLKFLTNKLKTIEINTVATMQLFKHLKLDGTFLFISSSEVYNGLFEYNLSEDKIGSTNTQHPRSPYIEGKKCGEVICGIYREKGYNVKVARLSISYGPYTKKNDSRVINSLINKGLLNDKIDLIDDGSSLRTFCYMDDVIEMLWNVMLHSKDFIYNVGGVETISILELANIIGDILDKPIEKAIINNELVGNPKLVNLSIDKYINEFGTKEFIPIKVGLLETIKWQEKLNLIDEKH